MVYTYRNDLLAPYLQLPQGDKVQAECTFIILCTLSKSHPFVLDVWVDGNGGLRSKTTVCLALLRVFPCVLIFLCQDRQQEGD